MQQVQLTLHGTPLENKPFRHITLDEQKEFSEFLEKIGVFSEKVNDEKGLKWCASEFVKYDCFDQPSHPTKTKYLNCGMRGICPRCSMAYSHKRAEIMYQYIRQNLANNLNFDLKMNQIVLTLPEDLQKDLDRKTFSKMIRYFITKMGIEAYGYSIQFRHSQNPLSSRYLHAHVLSLNIKESNQKLIQNDYFFNTDKMRELWKNTIEKFTESIVPGQVNIHTEYASVKYNKPKVVHLLAYLYRYSIQDLFQVQVRNHTIDYVQTEQFETDYVILQIEAMQKEPKNLTWCGLMTSKKRSYLEKLLSNTINELVTWKTIPFIIKQLDERSKTCRECGIEYFHVVDRGKYPGDNEPN